MLRWFRETGGDPATILLTAAAGLRRKRRVLATLASLALVALAVAVWLAMAWGDLQG